MREMEYVIKKQGIDGSSFSSGPNQPYKFSYIYGKGKLKILYYNIVLYILFKKGKKHVR